MFNIGEFRNSEDDNISDQKILFRKKKSPLFSSTTKKNLNLYGISFVVNLFFCRRLLVNTFIFISVLKNSFPFFIEYEEKYEKFHP